MKGTTPKVPVSTVQSSTVERGAHEIVGGRYRVLRPLGEGGMGSVLLVLDRREDYRPLALKRVTRGHVDARVLGVLRREFLVLASLRHPYLPRVYDFGSDSRTGDVFFTSEYVRGIPWDEAVAELDLCAPDGLEEFLSLLAQVLRALGFVHLLGKVHGDIKPANILVRPTPGNVSAGQVKLIDFGLTRGERELSDRIVGTPYYVAPESITSSRVDRRGDLYSLGVVLYELVTGRRPFSGRSSLELLRSHLEQTPVPVRERAPHVPEPLACVIEGLIARSPKDRFQTTAEVLATLQQAFDVEIPLETASTLEAYLERGRWVATERGQRSLQRMLAQTVRRTPNRCVPGRERARWVVLESSDPRRTGDLVRAFRQRVQARGTAFLEIEPGACTAGRERGSDGGGWNCLLRELCNYENVFEGEERPAYIRQLATLPDALAERVPTGAGFVRTRLVTAARELVAASCKRPFVLHVRDVHLGEPLLVGFLEALLAEAVGVPDVRFLISVSLPPAEALHHLRGPARTTLDVFDLLRKKHSPLELAVSSLNERSLSRLLHRAFRGCEFPRAFVRSLDAECEGNLEAVLETVRELLRSQSLARTPQGWSLSPSCNVEEVGGNRGLRLAERVRALPRPAFHLGAAFACLERPVPLAFAAELVGQNPAESAQSLQVLVDARLLHADAETDGEHYGFTRSGTREAYYAQIPEEERRDLHRRAGQLCENGTFEFRRRDRALAYHYLRANEPLKAVHYGLHAARELGRQFAPLRAMELYEQVLDIAGGDSGGAPDGCSDSQLDLGPTVSREIADLRFQLGDFRGALKCLDALVEREEENPNVRTPLFSLEAARVHTRLGQFDRAEQCIRAAQRMGADSFPLAFTRIELAHYRGDFRRSLRLAKRLLERDARGPSPELMCDLYLLLAEGHAELHDSATAATYCHKGVASLRGKETAHLIALRHFCRAKRLAYNARPAEAVAALRLSRRLWARMGARDREATCLLELGRLQVVLARPRRAQRLLKRALERFLKTGNQHGELRARYSLGEVCALTGDTERCQSLLAETLRAAGQSSRAGWRRRTGLVFAGVAMDSGDLENAGRYLYEAEFECEDSAGALDQARASLLRGRLSFERGEVGSSLTELADAVRLADASRDVPARRRAWLYSGLAHVGVGSRIGWRRAAEALRETAKRDVAGEAPAALLDGARWARAGEAAKAKKALGRAFPLLKARGDERDLALLYLERGLLSLYEAEWDQAYFELEEGAALARRLRHAHLRCRFFLAFGRLERGPSGEGSGKAADRYRTAQKLATDGDFAELLWQARLGLGRLEEAQDHNAAASLLSQARLGLRDVLDDLEARDRDGYLRACEYILGADTVAGFFDPNLAV